MVKKKSITVLGNKISVTNVNSSDYICLTDMVRNEDGNDHIRNWMRNRNTVEYLGLWERLNNPKFKGVEFDTFKSEAGLNSFNLTPKKWIESTDAIGIISKSGRNGGTYAHKDIAFEFGAWISAEFKLYIILEYQRLKEIESNSLNIEWDVKRSISKVNLQLQTDAVKDYIIPKTQHPRGKEWLAYAEEADLLNYAVFGCSAQDWRKVNPTLHLQKQNIRDYASINELIVISNLEFFNAELIKEGLDKGTRYPRLKKMAKEQLKQLHDNSTIKSLKRVDDSTYVKAQNNITDNS